MTLFPGVEAKLDRALDHYHEFATLMSTFADEPPVELAVRPIDDQGAEIYVSRVSESAQLTLLRLGLIAGDLIHNLRSAFDHFSYAVVPKLNSVQDRNTAFPIPREKPKSVSKLIGSKNFDKAEPAVVAAILQLQPWPSGTNPVGQKIWLLNELDVADKHHGLIMTVVTSDSRTSTFMQPVGRGAIEVQYSESFPLSLEAGAVLWSGSMHKMPSAMDTGTVDFDIRFADARVAQNLGESPAQKSLETLHSTSTDTLSKLISASV